MESARKIVISSSILLIGILVICVAFYLGIFGDHLQLVKSHFHQLPGWQQDDQRQALSTFQRSCTQILTLPPQAPFGEQPGMGQVQDWQAACQAAAKIKHPDIENARRFFENRFDPYQVKNHFNAKGLFTGYYLPLLQGSTVETPLYSIPIYGPPRDLVRVDLGLFKPELAGKSIVGRVQDRTLVPYFSRAEIMRGALQQKAPVLLWTNDLIKLFFAQIQGSAMVALPNHQFQLIGFADENGLPYTPIGKVLVTQKAIAKDAVSMTAIQKWLRKNPDQINAVLNQDASYIFFKLLPTTSPLGTQGVPLTPQRSMAVDQHFIPLGAPLWLVTKIPQHSINAPSVDYRRLFIAQDTGGAIKGIIRGDIYFGPGQEAEFMAGNMNQKGSYWILLPKQVSRK